MSRPAEPRLLVFKLITGADILKMQAISNISPTGGGARDLRFPFEAFDEVMSLLLPHTRLVSRRRKGRKQEVAVRYGDVNVGGTTREFQWEPPTTARPSEGRIPRISEHLEIPIDDAGLVFFVMLLDSSGRVGAYYAYEKDLESGKWQSRVSSAILSCRDSVQSPQGYVDFTSGSSYCHGAK